MVRGARSRLNAEEDWCWLTESFPFEAYVREGRRSAYEQLVVQALRLLPSGGRILDFGAGPCDKTALFARAGFDVVAFDDLDDPWHRISNNRQKILDFAHHAGVEYRTAQNWSDCIADGERFDMVMLHHVLEHLHSSPRALLEYLIGGLKVGGYLYVTVPNAVNIRKRLAVATGRTNYPSYSSFYWYPGDWRGHVREYVRGDLVRLAEYLNLRDVHIRSYFHFPHVLPPVAMGALRIICAAAPGLRDSWMLWARKDQGWSPAGIPDGPELARRLGRSEYYDYSRAE
jgi:SAM-dependent methyltransferase